MGNDGNWMGNLHKIQRGIKLSLEKIRLKAIDNKLQNQRVLLLEKLASTEIAIMLNNYLMEKVPE